MSDDELAAIRERDSELAEFAPRMDAVYGDRRTLLAEVVRLRAQLAEARRLHDSWNDIHNDEVSVGAWTDLDEILNQTSTGTEP
jgi:hypothetical protein